MNICTIFNTNQNQYWVGFWGEIWPKFHIQILATKLNLALLKVNEGFRLVPQIEVTTLKVERINFYILHLIFSFHYVSILIHHSLLEDYFVWHLYMFI
jgi:hypothetical protein